MARRGVASVAVVAILLVVMAGAAAFGYMYLIPSTHASSTTETQTPSVTAAAQTMILASAGNLTISKAALSNDSLLVTIMNKGSQAVSLDALVITPQAGCNLTGLAATSRTFSQANQTGQSNQTRIPGAFLGCLTRTVPFAVQSNSTLTPISRGFFNASRLFNSSSFNFTRSFSRSANFSRTISGNFSMTISGNFSGFPGAFGNFSTGLGRFLGNLTNGAGLQLAAGQSVTLAYSGPIGSGVAAGSQYAIIVAGPQGEAQTTISAS